MRRLLAALRSWWADDPDRTALIYHRRGEWGM